MSIICKYASCIFIVVTDTKISCLIEDFKGDILMEYLCQIKPIKAVMGIYSSLGGCKIYSLHDALNGCLSDEVVYVYLRLLASDQKKVRFFLEKIVNNNILALKYLILPV
nr:uncharacterized protein LOC124814846 [Hydra vulgaris]